MSEITEYNHTEAALSDLRQRYGNAVYDVATTKGMDEAKKARAELRTLRVDLEKMRKEIKEPALRRCQMIDSEAKRITAELTNLEDPIDAQIKKEERRKEEEKAERARIEAERVKIIRDRIQDMKALALQANGRKSAEIVQMMQDVEAVEITGEAFAEFFDEAIVEKGRVLLAMAGLRDAAIEREAEAERLRIEAERLAAERKAQEQAAAAERARLEEERRNLAEERAEIERMKRQAEEAAKPVVIAMQDDPKPADAVACINVQPSHEERVEAFVGSSSFTASVYEVSGVEITGVSDASDQADDQYTYQPEPGMVFMIDQSSTQIRMTADQLRAALAIAENLESDVLIKQCAEDSYLQAAGVYVAAANFIEEGWAILPN